MREQYIVEKGYSVVEMWECGMVETLEDWWASKGTLERTIPVQASIASEPLMDQDKIKRSVWLRAVWYQISRSSVSTICKIPTNFQKCKRMQTGYWTNNIGVCWNEKISVPTAAKVNF